MENFNDILEKLNKQHEQRRKNEAATDKERAYKLRLKKATAYNRSTMLAQTYGTLEY